MEMSIRKMRDDLRPQAPCVIDVHTAFPFYCRLSGLCGLAWYIITNINSVEKVYFRFQFTVQLLEASSFCLMCNQCTIII